MKNGFQRQLGLLLLALALLLTRRETLGQETFDRRVQQMTLEEKIQELHGIRVEGHYRYVPPVPRLGIPAFLITNGPANDLCD